MREKRASFSLSGSCPGFYAEEQREKQKEARETDGNGEKRASKVVVAEATTATVSLRLSCEQEDKKALEQTFTEALRVEDYVGGRERGRKFW